MPAPVVEFVAGHDIERPTTINGRRGYGWRRGYHRIVDGQLTFPAMTRAEASYEAAKDGCRAKFVGTRQKLNGTPASKYDWQLKVLAWLLPASTLLLRNMNV